MADSPPYPGAPRWVKVLGISVIVLLLLLVIMRLTGHGPGRHGPPEGHTPSGSHAPPEGMGDHALSGNHTPPEGGHR